MRYLAQTYGWTPAEIAAVPIASLPALMPLPKGDDGTGMETVSMQELRDRVRRRG